MRKLNVTYWPNTANVFPMAVSSSVSPDTSLMQPGVVSLVELAGKTSSLSKTGLFIPTATLAAGVTKGKLLSSGITLSQGLVMSEAGTTNPANPREKPLTGEP